MSNDANPLPLDESTQRRLTELLSASQELDSFSESDRQELNTLLRASEANREFAAQFLLDGESLKEHLAAQEITSLSSGRSDHISPAPKSPRLPRWAKATLAWATAFTISGILIFTWMNRAPIGIVSDQAGAEFANGMGPVNDTIESKSYALTSGMISLKFRNGVSMTLQAPAEFEVVDAFRVRLKQGYVRAIAPESGYGFIIETPGADVVDLGTEFGVGVDGLSGDSEVHVFDGRVDVHSRGSETALASLGFGEVASILGGKVSKGGTAKARQFISPGDVGFHRWGRASKAIKQDPDLVFYFGFDPTLGDELTLVDEAEQGNAVIGRIKGARWVTGRWPGKHALLFDQDSDAVHFDVPESLEQFTFSAWVNLDRLDEAKASILSSVGWGEGALHMHVNRSSHAFAAGIYQPLKRQKTRVKVSPGQWVMLTAVFDRSNRSTTTWINGEPSMEFQYQDFARVDAGPFLLGNYQAEIGGPVTRQFRGRMDEVILWRRKLDETEIKQLYQQGRPNR